MNVKLLLPLLAIFAVPACAQTGSTETDSMLRWGAGALDPEFDYSQLKNYSRQDAVRILVPVIKGNRDTTSGYFVASFLLACKGVDLKANTARVVRPALLWKENSTREFKVSNGLAPDAVMLEDVPQALYLIVRTQRYLPALRALITMPSDGAVAENQDDCIMNLLRQEPVTVIKLASVDKAIYGKLIDTIDWNVGPPPARKAFLTNLGRVKWPSAKLRHTALALIQAVKNPIHRDYRH